MGEEQPDSLYPFLVFFSIFLIIELDGRDIEVADRDLPFPLCPFPLPSSIDDSTESVFIEIEPIRNCQNQLLGTNCDQKLVVMAQTPMLEIQRVAFHTWKSSLVTQLNGIFVSCMPMSFHFEQSLQIMMAKHQGRFHFKGPLGRSCRVISH